MRAVAAMLFALLLAGCASMRISREDETMVDIQNTGWYLFNFIPLASGDPSNPNGHTCRLFRDSVTLANNMKILDAAMRQTGATSVRNLSSYTADEQVFIILLKRHAYHTSAQLVIEPNEPKE